MWGYFLVSPLHKLPNNPPNRDPRPLHHHNPRRQFIGKGEVAAFAQGHQNHQRRVLLRSGPVQQSRGFGNRRLTSIRANPSDP